jgi:hypothetical protein
MRQFIAGQDKICHLTVGSLSLLHESQGNNLPEIVQIDARGSTFNGVQGTQLNIIINFISRRVRRKRRVARKRRVGRERQVVKQPRWTIFLVATAFLTVGVCGTLGYM